MSVPPIGARQSPHQEGESLVSVKEARRRLGGISKHSIYALFDSGALLKVKLSKRTFATESSIQQLIAAGIEAAKAA